MVADDNLDQVGTVVSFLQLEGFDVRGFYSGEALLARFEAFKPNVVVLDLGMPGLTGFDVARTIRTVTNHKVLLVALSGYGTQTDKIASRTAGFDFHLTKPADPNALARLLKSYEIALANRPG